MYNLFRMLVQKKILVDYFSIFADFFLVEKEPLVNSSPSAPGPQKPPRRPCSPAFPAVTTNVVWK